jgi:ATP-dependent helicase/DNAse subunit B
MLLLSGPAGSAATSHILAEFRQALRPNASNVRLLVPTATMAEHLRHKLAREGFVFRPGLILTLSKFLEPWAEDLPEVSSTVLYLLVDRTVRRLAPVEFALVLTAPGFCAALAQAIQEFSAASCDADRLQRSLPHTPFGAPFVAVYREVERELARRGLGLRSARLERAAQRIARQGLPGVDTVWMDGFFTLSDAEMAVIRAIGAHADLTVSLPNMDGPNHARDTLLAMGAEERSVQSQRRAPIVRTFVAPTVDREAEEIARRILDEATGGVAFRDIGIIVRNHEGYLPALKAALERFGIPARFYFSGPLNENGAVRYLDGVVTALLSGWDYAATLAALRFSGDTPELDQFDFAVREQMPGHGLDGLKALAKDLRLRQTLDYLRTLDPWASLALSPGQWVSRLGSLRQLVRPPQPCDGIPQETAAMWRSQANALAGFEAALAEAGAFLGDDRKVSLAEFWPAVQAVLRLTPLRVPDLRRNVAHVMSAFEARQWELPVTFICGLAEQQFPKRQTQEPLFSDSARLRLAQSGIRVRTAAELEREERFLFELASATATSRLTLSYPEADARGVRNMPSQFLTHQAEPATQLARPRPQKTYADTAGPLTGVSHAVFSPSGLECFLDCPFQFFARYTLKLRTRPLLPQNRLDFMLQGTIIHQTLSEWRRDPQPIELLFHRVFSEHCALKSVFPGYRTEYLRRQMLDDLRRFAEDPKLPAFADVLTEQQFEMTIGESLRLRGRIDRIEKLSGGRALIVDYKYSAAQRVAARMTKETLLQGGLYALAVERQLGLKPAGVVYYGLKRDLKIVGWTDPPGEFGLDSEPLTRQWIDSAVDMARRAANEILAGRVAPDPVDLDLCRLCEYCDVCRYDGAGRAVVVAQGT